MAPAPGVPFPVHRGPVPIARTEGVSLALTTAVKKDRVRR
jgi:hypothetical protein